MVKTITTKYGTKINVDGLTPEQIVRVRSTAEDKGAYGAKGAALAKELQKKNTSAAKAAVQPKPAASVAAPAAPAKATVQPPTAPSITTASAAPAKPAQTASPKSITTKYGTKINVEGLTPEQIEKVRKTAEDKGAYGDKGKALADEMRKRNNSKRDPAPGKDPGQKPDSGPQKDPPTVVVSPIEPVNLGIKPGVGTIDPAKATIAISGAEELDSTRTFNMQNPGEQTDALGNKKIITRDPVTGMVTTKVESGALANEAKGILGGALENLGVKGTLNLSSAPSILETGDVRSEAQKVGDANYAYLTRNVERDKRREIEAAKQELANRGIPIDYGNPDSMWNKAIGAINQRYDDLDLTASQQAIIGRDASTGALISGQNVARDAFLKSAGMEADNARSQVTAALAATGATAGDFTPYAGGSVDQSGVLQGLLGKISDAELAKYGIDKDYAAKLRAIAKGGGGGGGNTGGGFAIGGVAP